MKKIVFVMLTSALVIRAMAQTPSAEADAAHKVLTNCLLEAVAQLDDGKSGVETIAKVAAGSCRKESSAFVDAFIAGHYPIDRDAILQAEYQKDIESASYFLLRLRSMRK